MARQYIETDVLFHTDGRMQPERIYTTDGICRVIDRVKTNGPGTSASGGQGDIYMVRCGKDTLQIVFEHSEEEYDWRIGRWFLS